MKKTCPAENTQIGLGYARKYIHSGVIHTTGKPRKKYPQRNEQQVKIDNRTDYFK